MKDQKHNHQWIINPHQGTKYCSRNCDGFKEVKATEKDIKAVKPD